MVAMSEAEAELIAGLKVRSPESMDALLERYWAPAYRVAYQLTGDPGAAEDVAQDTLIGVLRGVGKLREDDPFRAWFFRVLANTAKNHQRSRRRRDAHEQRARHRPPPATPAARVERAEDVALVRRHLEGLSPKLRHALALRYLEGLSLLEVAEALGVPRKTASSRIKRGVEALRDSLRPTAQLTEQGIGSQD